MTMKKLISLTILAGLLSSLPFIQASAQQSDPIRNQLKWDRPAAPSNADGDIEKVFFGYTRPDKKHFNLIAQLPFAIASDQFTGGDIKEPDINFDGIPDLLISLGSLNGYGAFVYEGYVWNAGTHQFQLVSHFREIVNPEFDPNGQRIMSYNRKEKVIEVSEWRWKGGLLVMTNRHTEDIEKYETPNSEIQMQSRALVGNWLWADDGELPSDIQLTLSLDYEDGFLYVSECTIYGSTGAFDVDCTYVNGLLTLTDAPGLEPEMSSLNAQLRLNPRGDLIGTFTCRVGEETTKGTVTLRLKE